MKKGTNYLMEGDSRGVKHLPHYPKVESLSSGKRPRCITDTNNGGNDKGTKLPFSAKNWWAM
jgi:hypothetical protein